MKLTFLCSILVAMLLSSCGPSIEGLKLGSDLKKKYHCEQVSTSISDEDQITIELINCPCYEAGHDEQQNIADTIGKLVPTYFNKYHINQGELDFEKRHNFVMGNTSVSINYDMHIK